LLEVILSGFELRFEAMEQAEIERIREYITNLEGGLVEWDYDNITMQIEIPYLYQIVKQLMDATLIFNLLANRTLPASL